MPAKSTNRRKRRLHRSFSRGGRPREDGVLRTPSGRKSRSSAARRETQLQVMATALDARMRQTGLRAREAAQPQAGSALGLLQFDGHLKAREVKAGEYYAETLARHYGLAGISFPSARAQNLFAVRGHAGDETENRAEAAKKASARAAALDRVLLNCDPRGHRGQQIRAKIYSVCIFDDRQSREWNKYTIGLVAKGLSAVADEMGWE